MRARPKASSLSCCHSTHHTLDFDACSAVAEMHDRMIAADARRINAALLTRDAQITSSGVVATVW
jgi:PIN domain nuclease of toxin-antitoxin system